MAKTIQQARPEQAPAPAAASGRKTPRSVRVLTALLAAVSLVIGAGAAYGFGFYMWANGSRIVIPNKEIPHIGGPCISGACNVLVLGSDSRAGLSKSERILFGSTKDVSGHRSDTIMLVHLDPREKKAVILSFPRDLWVNIPHQGMGKITSAYEGGADRVAQVIENISGLHVNHLVAVNLAGFQAVVQALGGVPICVDRPMFDQLAGLNLPHAGCYNLNGFQALAFVRARHVQGDCIPDFSRIARQQQFLRAVLAKILSKRELLHAPSLIKAALSHLALDQGLKLADLVYLTRQLQGISTGAATFRAVPGTPQTVSTGQSVVIMDPVAKTIFKRLKDGKPIGNLGLSLEGTATSPANIAVRVFDASSGGKADKVDSLLVRAGFEVRNVLPAGSGTTSSTAVILYRSNEKPMADVVHGFFPSLQEKPVPRSAIPGVDVALVIPASYEGPGVTNATPGTNQPGSGAPGGPTC